MARHFYRYGTQLWKEIESYVFDKTELKKPIKKEKKSSDFVQTLLKKAFSQVFWTSESQVEETSENIHTVVFDGF